MSQATLLADAATIKNETIASANTATRVGEMLEDIINEAVPYKIYKALLTQTGTNAPVATVLENTFGGTLVFAYAAPGNYTITLANAFTTAKTTILIGPGDSSGVIYAWEWNSKNQITVFSLDIAATKTNALFNNTTIEITVYP